MKFDGIVLFICALELVERIKYKMKIKNGYFYVGI